MPLVCPISTLHHCITPSPIQSNWPPLPCFLRETLWAALLRYTCPLWIYDNGDNTDLLSHVKFFYLVATGSPSAQVTCHQGYTAVPPLGETACQQAYEMSR